MDDKEQREKIAGLVWEGYECAYATVKPQVVENHRRARAKEASLEHTKETMGKRFISSGSDDAFIFRLPKALLHEIDEKLFVQRACDGKRVDDEMESPETRACE